ncbi:MAG: PEP-CTERM sorting domain-containing protein [Kiritimatiellae bacterium]|nr:PEP-CTERM sorting domain-containing protein [Kiritimatiellia bacterium]
MKKAAFSFALAGLLAASAGAMQIDWNIDDVGSVLSSAGITSSVSSPQWQYVFLTKDANDNYSDNNGSNIGYESDSDGAGATWSDETSGTSATYVVALWDGVSTSGENKVLSVLQNNGSDITVNVTAGTDPSLGPGSWTPSVDAETLPTVTGSKAVTVPEPATAALALAGLALLIRRRK